MPKPYRALPPTRKTYGDTTSSIGKPSANLGHVFNQTINKGAHLFDKVGVSNPLPFSMVAPTKHINTHPHIGGYISGAITALTRPTMAHSPTIGRGNVALGTRVTAVIDSFKSGIRYLGPPTSRR